MKKKTGPFMGKFWVQLSLLVLAVTAVASLAFLSVKIHYWEKQLASAQSKIEKGQQRLVRGKQRLKNGKQELSEGRAEYDEAEDSMFLELIDDVFDGGDGFATAREEIADGEKKIAGGQKKLAAGKRQLTAGRH
ncbi:hypothetical protein KJ865_04475, partial [Myxococcota bacterium]|nr:hypothetical protein [Myxococcota bacterium]